MIRIALILLISLAVSSQAVAAVKWNNSGKATCKEAENKSIKLHRFNTPFSKEFKKFRKDMNKATLAGFNKKLMPHDSNVNPKHPIKLSNHKGENAIAFHISAKDAGGIGDWNRFGVPGHAQRLQFIENDGGIALNEEMWYRIGFYLSEDYSQVQNGQMMENAISFFDFKHLLNCNEITHQLANIAYRGGRFELYLADTINYDRCKSNEQSGNGFCRGAMRVFDLGPSYKGEWVHVIMNVKFSDSEGYFRMWFNGQQVVNFEGGFPLGEADAVRFKFGPYRIKMDKDTERNLSVPDMKVHYSGVGRADNCERLWGKDGCGRMKENWFPKNTIRTKSSHNFGPWVNQVRVCDQNYESVENGSVVITKCEEKSLKAPFAD